MKKIFTLIIILLLLPSVLALNLKVERPEKSQTIIPEINKPAVFNIKVTNLGETDNLQFYNLLGFRMTPVGTVQINASEIKDIEVRVYPKENFNKKGLYTLQYFIRGNDKSEVSEKLNVEFIELEDAFEIGSDYVDPSENFVNIYIKNKESIDFDEINVKFSSLFFEFEKDFTLGPNEKAQFSAQLNQADFKKIFAGYYTLKAEVNVDGETANLENTIRFIEKDLVETTQKDYGLIIFTKIIKKENQGNVISNSTSVIKKNIISRLFTNFEPEPDFVERDGISIYYTWERQINPGESLNIVVKTNWLFPLLIIIAIIVIVVFVKNYTTTNLAMRKKVSFVKAKGGEFALKVSITIHAKKYIENIHVVDRLPYLAKIHERFGGEQPTEIDEKNHRVKWKFEKLEEGEIRLLTYIIYSKVGVVGKFALPSARAAFKRKGEVEQVESNRAFFVAEQRTGQITDEEDY